MTTAHRLHDTTDALRRELAEAKDVLGRSRIEDQHYFLDQALGRYLWGAAAIADSALALAMARKAAGADALIRQLHEALIDVSFILSSPDPDLCAAQSALKDLLDWRELWGLHAQVVRTNPDYPFPPIPDAWQAVLGQHVAANVDALDKVCSDLGGPPDLFTRAKAVLDASGRWHWSGMSRHQMITELTRRGELQEAGAAIALTVTKLYNVGSHASPSWSVLAVDIKDERAIHSFPDPSSSDDDDLVRLASTASHFLSGIRAAVSTRILPPRGDA